MPVFRSLYSKGRVLPEIIVYVAYRSAGHASVMVTSVSIVMQRVSGGGFGFGIDELPISAQEFKIKRSMNTEHAT